MGYGTFSCLITRGYYSWCSWAIPMTLESRSLPAFHGMTLPVLNTAQLALWVGGLPRIPLQGDSPRFWLISCLFWDGNQASLKSLNVTYSLGVVFMNKTMLCQIRSHKHTYTNDFLYTCAYIYMHLLNLCEHYQDIYIHWDFFHDQESYDQNHIESIVLLDFF